ncbi:MAG: phospholipase D-like domain-containing protein, partial [Candidatus Omnitrophota bacterium]|nr:phospholipase D-like domain-containing protein [Candidatus Omnitrophota bacterium]
KNRGVDVEVILDQNVDFVRRKHPSDWEVEIKSTRAYKRLKDAGIKVYYDEPARYTHAKTVIIDKKIVILGSTNWSESAFDNSIETDVFVNSTGLADEILSYLKTIKIDENVEKYLEVTGPSTHIRWDFLENPKLAPQMVKMHGRRDFDVYLYLLWKLGDTPRPIGRPGAPPSAGAFELPNVYFDFGWNRELSLRAKFCLFINLDYFQISDTLPFWSESLPTITRQFGGVSRDVIIKGMEELRRKKLIEVKYDELTGKPYDDKAPKMYKLLKLYDPKELGLKLKAIEDKYGKQAYTKARRYAEIVFEENNPVVIEDIILKTKQYGEKKIKKAFDIVALKNIDNPKRSYGYAVGIIEKIEDAKP